MNKVILILSLLAISALAMPVNLDELKSLWGSWKGYYGKSYGLAEEGARFAIFVENYKRIVEFNSKNINVKQALNQFADITGEEFKNLYSTNFFETEDIRAPDASAYSNVELPTSVDWRTKGAVTPVKNQGQCGSCWAFSATGALEGLNFIDTGSLVALSEQALVDCVSKNQGCNGGSISAAFAYTASHGVPTEADYPYTGQDGTCQTDKKTLRVNSGFQWVPFHDSLALKTAVTQQPVSVSIEADQDVFQFYSSGVISSGCGSNTDHAVLVVGYDETDAFIVKNSWGASWGQNGYVMIAADGSANGGSGVCGILTGPVVPLH